MPTHQTMHFRARYSNRLWLLTLLSGIGIAVVAPAADLTKQVGPVSVGSVEHFLALVGRSDTNALLDLDFAVQADLAALRANTPQFLLERKVQEYTAQKKPALLNADQNDYAKLLMLLPLAPKRTIVEIGGTEPGQILAYVSFRFNTPEASPLAGEAFESMWSVRPEPVRFLQEAVLAVHFSPEGFFRGVSTVPDTAVFWEGLPFRIIAVQASGSSDFLMKIKTTGDQPVGKATVRFGDYVLERDDISPDPKGFIINNGYFRAGSDDPYTVQARLDLQKEQLGSTSNILVIITLNGKGGQKDEVCFTMEKLGGDQFYMRHPWNQHAPWKGRVGTLTDRVAEELATSKARRVAENRIHESANEKLAAIIRAGGPFAFSIREIGERQSEYACKVIFDKGFTLEDGNISGRIVFPKGLATKIVGSIRNGEMTFQEVEILVQGEDRWKPGDKYALRQTSEGALTGSRYARGVDGGPVKLTFSSDSGGTDAKLIGIVDAKGPFDFWIKEREEHSCKISFDSGVQRETGRFSGRIAFPRGTVTKIVGFVRNGEMTFQEVETLVQGGDNWNPGDNYVLLLTSEGALTGRRQDNNPVRLTFATK